MLADRGMRPMRVAGVDFPFHAYLFKRRGDLVYVYFCIMEEGNPDRNENGLLQDWSGASRIQRAFSGLRNLGQQIEGLECEHVCDATLEISLAERIVTHLVLSLCRPQHLTAYPVLDEQVRAS